MMRWTLASMAAFYADQQSIDVRKGHERRVRDGWFVSKGPYGYRNERVDGRSIVRIDEPAAANICRIFELFAMGTYTLIRCKKNFTPRGRVFRDKRPKFPRDSCITYYRSCLHRGDRVPRPVASGQARAACGCNDLASGPSVARDQDLQAQ